MTDVKVAVLEKPGVHALLRIRPGRGDERVRSELLNLRGPTCVEFRPSGSVYSFDAVLGQEAEQADVFEIIRPLINSLFSERCNSTILTYGQTGSGKTHTLIGTTKEQGILPRAASMLCDAMRMRPSEKIKVSSGELDGLAARQRAA